MNALTEHLLFMAARKRHLDEYGKTALHSAGPLQQLSQWAIALEFVGILVALFFAPDSFTFFTACLILIQSLAFIYAVGIVAYHFEPSMLDYYWEVSWFKRHLILHGLLVSASIAVLLFLW